MPRGNLNDLLAFVAVGRERSFTKAAAKLGPAQALGWLDLLASLMPETVKIDFEVSGYLVFVFGSLVALGIWRQYPRKGRQE